MKWASLLLSLSLSSLQVCFASLAQATTINPSSMSVTVGTSNGSVSDLSKAGDGNILYIYSSSTGHVNATFVFNSIPAAGGTLNAVFTESTAGNNFNFEALNSSGSWVVLGKTKASGTLAYAVPSSVVVGGKVTVAIVAGPSVDDCTLDLLTMTTSGSSGSSGSGSTGSGSSGSSSGSSGSSGSSTVIDPSSMTVGTGSYNGTLADLTAAGDGNVLDLYSSTTGVLNASFVFTSVPSTGGTLNAVFAETTAGNVFTFEALNSSGSWVTLGSSKASGTLTYTVPSSVVVSGKVTVAIVAGPSADDCTLDLLTITTSGSSSSGSSGSSGSGTSGSGSSGSGSSGSGSSAWNSITSYAIQYNNVSATAMAAGPYGMYILDRADSSGNDWTAAELAPVKTNHLLAGYFDGTHAENWRTYWTSASASYIIGATSYSGEYYAQLNSPAWIAISEAYIDQLAAMGFTAVFIDNCDAYNDAAFANYYGSTTAAEQATITFLQTLRSYASSKHGMVLIANNGIELAAMSGYSTAVDGLMYEDIFGGNSSSSISYITTYLNDAKALGKFILDEEATTSLSTAQTYISDAKGYGYIPYVTSDAAYGTLGFAGQTNGFINGE